MENRTIKELHYASQYLAAAAKSYLPAKADDSHTNLAWNVELRSFDSRPLEGGDILRLYAEDLRLEWIGEHTHSLGLSGRTHGEVITWLHHIALKRGYGDYEFEFDYHIGKGWASPARIYEDFQVEEAKAHCALRDIAQKACEDFLSESGLKSELRVWPHHFDTGAYVTMENGLGLGFGMATADAVMTQEYMYAAGYSGHDGVVTADFSPLKRGEWKNGDFKGAVCEMRGLTVDDALSFLKESSTQYSAISSVK